MSIDGPAVRRLRELSGMSVKTLAALVERSPEYVRNIENQDRFVKRNPELVKKFADAFGVHRQMIERKDEP